MSERSYEIGETVNYFRTEIQGCQSTRVAKARPVRSLMILLTTLTLLFSQSLWADESTPISIKRPIDFYAVVQSGGYLGLISLGAGFTVSNIWDLNIQVGYTPPQVDGSGLAQISAKTSLHPFAWMRPQIDINAPKKIEYDPLYLGAGFTMAIDEDLFFTLPEQYPEAGYYKPTAIHWFPFVGTALRFGDHELFAEYSIADYEFMILVREHDNMEPEDFFKLGSLSLGYLYHF
jgi:hypothetical protein